MDLAYSPTQTYRVIKSSPAVIINSGLLDELMVAKLDYTPTRTIASRVEQLVLLVVMLACSSGLVWCGFWLSGLWLIGAVIAAVAALVLLRVIIRASRDILWQRQLERVEVDPSVAVYSVHHEPLRSLVKMIDADDSTQWLSYECQLFYDTDLGRKLAARLIDFIGDIAVVDSVRQRLTEVEDETWDACYADLRQCAAKELYGIYRLHLTRIELKHGIEHMIEQVEQDARHDADEYQKARVADGHAEIFGMFTKHWTRASTAEEAEETETAAEPESSPTP